MQIHRKSNLCCRSCELTFFFSPLLADYATLTKLLKDMPVSSPKLERLTLRLPNPYLREGRRISPCPRFQALFDDQDFTFPLLKEVTYLTDCPEMAFSLKAFFLRHSEIQVLHYHDGTSNDFLDRKALPKLRYFAGSSQNCINICTSGTRPIERVELSIITHDRLGIDDEARRRMNLQIRGALAKTPSIRQLCIIEPGVLRFGVRNGGLSLNEVRNFSDSCPNLTRFEFLLDYQTSQIAVRV